MLQNEPNFMLVRYSIAELLMIFEVSAQCEYTIAEYIILCQQLYAAIVVSLLQLRMYVQ